MPHFARFCGLPPETYSNRFPAQKVVRTANRGKTGQADVVKIRDSDYRGISRHFVPGKLRPDLLISPFIRNIVECRKIFFTYYTLNFTSFDIITSDDLIKSHK